jgi:hypothetical protein
VRAERHNRQATRPDNYEYGKGSLKSNEPLTPVVAA